MKLVFDRAHAAIDFLSHHRLDPTPAHYHLALVYLALPGGPLAREIEKLTDGSLRLGEEQAARLIATYVCTPHVAAREVRFHADTLQTITDDAHDLTSTVGRDLTRLSDDAQARDALAERMIERLAQAERELRVMRGDIADLQGRLHPGASDAEADLDTLTEVTSRRGATAAVAGLAGHAKGYVIALCLVDGVEHINERYGRSVGDNVLRALASTLARACVGHEVVRWSGNEFVVLMKGAALAAARVMLEDARDAMKARTFRLRGSGALIGTITLSAGLAAGRGGPAEPVIDAARDKAVTASQAGGDRIAG